MTFYITNETKNVLGLFNEIYFECNFFCLFFNYLLKEHLSLKAKLPSLISFQTLGADNFQTATL